MTANRARARRRAGPPPLYWLLLVVVVSLTLVGLVMVLSASFVHAARAYGSSWYYFNRQLMWTVAGASALVVASRVDYRRWQRFAVPAMAVTVGLLVLVLVPGVGISAGGSTRWLGIGHLRMQPSELAKFALALFAADLLTRRVALMSDWRATARPVMVAVGVIAVLVIKQPDLGTTLICGAIAIGVLWVAGTRLPVMVATMASAACGTLALAMIEPYRWQRITSFLDPFADPGNTGYQAAQGLVALGSGQLTGAGLGASRAKWGFLPAAHTDFIFAIIGEELGLVGTLSVVALFGTLAVLLVRLAVRAPDRFGTLLVTGVTVWLIGQAITNIGAVIGLLPITGVPLPFVSAGGSSLVIAMAATGVVLNIARQSRPPRRAAAQ